VRGRQLGAERGEAKVAVAGEDEPHAGGGTVHGGDDRLRHAEVIREVRVELGAHAVAGHGHVIAQAGVVGAALDVTLERAGVGAGAEAPPGPGDDDHAHLVVRAGAGEQPPVLGVHAPRPGIQACGPVQRDRRDAIAHLVARGLQFAELHLSRGCCTE